MQSRSSSTGFRRRFRKKVAEKVPGGFGAKPGRVLEKVLEQVGEALVQPDQVQQGSGEGSSAWLRSTLQKDL